MNAIQPKAPPSTAAERMEVAEDDQSCRWVTSAGRPTLADLERPAT